MASTYLAAPNAEVSTCDGAGTELRFVFDATGVLVEKKVERQMVLDALVTRGIIAIPEEKT